jgi:uncharacterized OB-fold protein
MTETSSTPDVSALVVPMDVWTQPFWDAAARGELKLVRCADCRRYRWPPGPFCPYCQSQSTEWTASGPAVIYSFTVLPERGGPDGQPARIHAPALVEFPQADGVRFLAAVIDAPIDQIAIGAELELSWSSAENAKIPVFRLAGAAKGPR